MIRKGDLVAWIAEPDRRRKLRGDAAERDVQIALARAGFGGHRLPVCQARIGTGPLGPCDHRLHNLDGRMSHFRRDNLLTRGSAQLAALFCRVVDKHLAVGFGYRQDGIGVVAHALVRDDRIGRSHVEHRHVVGAERHGRRDAERRRDAHALGDLGHLVHAHGHLQPHEAGVRRHLEGARDAARAVIVVVDIFKVGVLGVRNARRGRAVDHRVGIDARLKGGDERERLERRTGRTTGMIGIGAFPGGKVHLRVATDHGFYVSRGRLDAHERPLDGIAVGFPVDLLQFCRDRRLGLLLHRGIERRDDGQAAAAHLVRRVAIGAIRVGEQVLHVTDEVRVLIDALFSRKRFVHHKRLGLRRVMLLLGDVAVRQHAVEHEVATFEAVLTIVDKRVVERRGLRNAHKRCRLGKREIRGILREVALRRGLDAVGAVTVVDGVEVHEQNLVFRVLLLKLHRQVHLAHLALEGDVVHFVDEDGVAHKLLGDGGRAFAARPRDVHDERTGDAHEVEAAVVVEALVLGGDGSLEDVRADLAQLHRIAILQLELREHRPVFGPHLRRHRHIERIHVLVVGQILQPRRSEGPHARETRDDNRHENGDDSEQPDFGMLLFGARPVLNRA